MTLSGVANTRENESVLQAGKYIICSKRWENVPAAKEGKHVACAERRENKPFAKAGKHVACVKGRETNLPLRYKNMSLSPKYLTLRRQNMSHVLKGGKTNLSQRRENMSHVLKGGKTNLLLRRENMGTALNGGENEPNVSQKQKLERDFVERQSLLTLIHEVIS